MSAVFPLKDNQRHAVAPDRTVWLSASAGTGKTQVLTARVLRLLLEPAVEPEQILCLTFTKAGAAEMATRVSDVLARWVRLPETELFKELGYIGAPLDEDTRLRARSRFAAVLDCPGGGLRIGTIHSFAQWLLAAFPVEAGLTPGTRAMEDRDRDLLARQVLADMLAQAQEQGDAALFETLEMLSLRMTQDQVEGFLMRCASARDLWFGPGAWTPPLRARVNRLIGLPPDDSGDPADIAAFCADDAFDCASVRGCMAAQAAWGTAKAIDAANMMGDWLVTDPAGRLAGIDDFADLFLTKAGEPRKTSALDKRAPDYPHHAARVIASLAALRERQALAELVNWIEPALGLGRRFALAWDDAKAREGLIDFDDQIRSAAALLNQQDMAEWVRYKLDRRFDHVLVDEAQDTNAAQWDIINALVGDFFTGEGQRGDRLRTLFVVGDYKQAIFRFQGTSPENFARARDRVRHQLAAVAEAMAEPERALLDLGLARSYRTAAPVLDFVDLAIEAIGPERFGRIEAIDPHMGENRPGLVAMWNPISTSPADGGDDGESEAVADGEDGDEGWLSRPDRQLADTLARQIRTWMESGFPLLKGRHRLAGPGDIMVLVRKRKELAGLIVARLHAQGVPVSGVDRLRLGAPLAVKDLVAGLRFAVQPFDDLNLANLLVSPLIGWSQEQLLEYGWRPGKLLLWEHLREREGLAIVATMDRLRALLALADRTSPQALLHWMLLGPWQGRKALVARLGGEANDPIDELLNAAGAFAGAGTPSLHGFLQWFDAGEGELKREQGRAGDQVRVMTVHGAKGLQAPIVILADAVDDPDASPPRGALLEEKLLDTIRNVPIPPLRKQEKVAAIHEAEERAQREEREEHWRLLYVAMTRAEEALFIGGAMGPKMRELPVDSWYAQLKPLFPQGSWRTDPLWQERAELGALAPRPAMADDVPRPAEVPPLELPDWLTQPVGPEPRPPRPLAPSSLGEEQAPDPPPRPGPGMLAAARRGTLLHKLIERLPERLPGERRDAALAWLAGNAADLDVALHHALAASAVRVLAQPGWEDVFGSDSLAEVPIAALVGGRMVSGAIDRLVIASDAIRIVDFKTARRPPERIEHIPTAYLRQMAAYTQALGVIYPHTRIEAALLYTETPVLFALPVELLARYKLDTTPTQTP